MPDFPTLAAVDLGSNSFHLQVARVVGEQVYPLDGLREPVRLGAGLRDDKTLDETSQERALECLMRFGERLRTLPRGSVRAVGTNTLRVAKNARAFLKRAQVALGVPIDIIAGREEARLIYLGVAHSLPTTRERRFVIDIGGGSTEFIIGAGLKPLKLDSLYMGCVSWSMRFFPEGKVTKSALKQAELAARAELQSMAASYRREHWSEAVASSGTARSIAELLRLNGMGDGTITPRGIEELRAVLLKAGDVARLNLEGLRADRVQVLAGGFSIMSAVVDELKIASITIANGALRQGILWDLLGRVHHHDKRDVTTVQLMRRYHVDAAQAKRVARLAAKLLTRIVDDDSVEAARQAIGWAASLHEIGVTVAYNGYHKHSAYILRNADMPGFSRMEQEQLALLVLAHRGQLRKLGESMVNDDDWPLVAALRFAALFHRSRSDAALPEIALKQRDGTFILSVPEGWLAENPLTETTLREEIKLWRGSGRAFELRRSVDQDAGAALLSTA